MKTRYPIPFATAVALAILAGSDTPSVAESVIATDGGTTVYGACNGVAIDFDATAVTNAVWTPALVSGQSYKLNSLAIKNASGNTGTYYLGVYTHFSGGVLSGFQGVSDAANDFSTSPHNWLAFTFSNLTYSVTVDSTVGSDSGMLYFIYQSGTSAITSPNVTLGTDRFSANTYMTNSLASIIAGGGLVANRSPQYQATITPGLPTCYVNVASNLQTIDGFGFSSAWCGQLSSAKNNALYGTLGMTILRVHISENEIWNFETSNSVAAHAVGAVVLGSSWAAPSWMTDTNRVVLPQYYADFSTWLGKAATNLLLDYVSPANEPDLNNFHWTTNEMFSFMKSNAPAIGKAVVMPESFRFDEGYSDPVLNDPVAVSNCVIVAGHIYGGLGDHGNRVQTNAITRGKRVWMTEHYVVDDTLTNMASCINTAKEVSDCMNNQMNAYVWWWVNEGEPTVNLASDTGAIFKNGYTLGQFAKWVRPRMVRCGATYNPTADVFITAYHGETNGIVMVAVNTNMAPVNQVFTISNATNVNMFGIHRTSDSESMTNLPGISVTNNTFSYPLPGRSVTTFVQFFGTVPTAPAALNAAIAPSGQISLNWSAVTNATGYFVKRSPTSGGPYTTIAPWVTGTNFNDMLYFTGVTYYYVVSAANDGGESSNSSQASATTPASLNLEPVADSYVNDGSSANNNYGTAANLVTKTTGGTNDGFNRISYLRFDVRALTNAQSAKLILTPTDMNGNISLAYEWVTNDAWSETGITWSNQPGGSGVIFTNVSGYVLNVPVTINLTAAVKSQATNDGYLSLRVMDTNSHNLRIDFYSREVANSNYRPVLQVTNPLGNTPPMLAAITNRTIGVGVTMSITNVATDSDVPAQALTFSLMTAPTNASINTSSGVLTWRPLTTQANTTNSFTVMVADNGTPSMSAMQSFVVTVPPLTQPQFSSVSLNGNQLILQINGASGPDYQIQASTNLVNWSAVLTTNSPAVPFSWTISFSSSPMNFFRILVGPPF